MHPSGIVFDLDGTLIDSRRDLATAVNRLRGELGMAPLAMEGVIGMVGEGARTLISRALGPDFPADRLEAAFSSYRSFYRDVCLDATVAYPGIPELLADLAPRFPLAVLTNKGEQISRTILEGLGLAHYFRAVIGGDTLPARKPDPEGLIHIADLFGVPVESLLLIGDSRFDAETAQAAGCRFSLVKWGFATPKEQESMTANLKVRTAEELASALK
ncbi:MAG TPA: HAD-IA family hydrolase [Thermoanaerobaculia bacterium]|nr:HAD-IA family hydrolase [Thermoanaerobaculia bacterium]